MGRFGGFWIEGLGFRAASIRRPSFLGGLGLGGLGPLGFDGADLALGPQLGLIAASYFIMKCDEDWCTERVGSSIGAGFWQRSSRTGPGVLLS